MPCMIRYSPGGGITPDILTDILRTVDTIGIYERERQDGITPFLLVDGHKSRFSPTFLKYITNPQHKWKVCIGVPYGTSLWQVGDSPQQNGRYKSGLTRKKRKILTNRILRFIADLEIVPTDIIPMINDSWAESFADVEGNKTAIFERGWFPLNKILLLHPDN